MPTLRDEGIQRREGKEGRETLLSPYPPFLGVGKCGSQALITLTFVHQVTVTMLTTYSLFSCVCFCIQED